MSKYGSIDVQPKDGHPGLGDRVLYRGYLIGYPEAWIVVHARGRNGWTGNYAVEKVNPNAHGYWEVPRDTFGSAGPGSTVDVLLVVPLDQHASDWLLQDNRHREDPNWPRDDASFNRLNKNIVDKMGATRTR